MRSEPAPARRGDSADETAEAVHVSGDQWQEVHRGVLPNRAGARQEVELPALKAAAVRIRILSTHDEKGARSCGLGLPAVAWTRDWIATVKDQALRLQPARNEAKGQHPGSRLFPVE